MPAGGEAERLLAWLRERRAAMAALLERLVRTVERSSGCPACPRSTSLRRGVAAVP